MNKTIHSNASPRTSEFVAAAEALRPIIEANREALAKGPDLPQPVAEALIRAGLAQLWLPRSLGGPEIDPLELFHVIEALARLDGSVAWCALLSSGASRFAGMLAATSARQLLQGRKTVAFSGGGHPTGSITRDGEGWRVSGRWTWMSFSRYSNLFALVCMEHENGQPSLSAEGGPVLRAMMLPSDKVQVSNNWDGGGLRSSGSHDITCTDVWVPDDCTTSLDMPLREPGPIYNLPMTTAAAISIMGIPLGIASASIDALIALARTKVAFVTTTPLREQEIIQLEVAWAKTRLHAARAFAIEAITSLWASLSSGQPASLEQQAMVRMACWNAGDAGKEIVDRMYSAAGSTAILEKEGFAAQLRDVHAAIQHINFAKRLMAVPGRILLGLEPGTPLI